MPKIIAKPYIKGFKSSKVNEGTGKIFIKRQKNHIDFLPFRRRYIGDLLVDPNTKLTFELVLNPEKGKK